jgi:hypothetical protein
MTVGGIGPDSVAPTTQDEPGGAGPDTSGAESKDDAIRAVVERLARRHPAGGAVIERAAILAEGADCTAIVAWIMTHDGQPEAATPTAPARGLHSPRLSGPGGAERNPVRYVLPAGALG